MDLTQKVAEFSKLAQCSVCSSLKSQNFVLAPCGHSACKDCLDKIMALPNNAKVCPQCKSNFQIPSNGKFTKDLKKNQLVELVVQVSSSAQQELCGGCELKAAILWCENCGFGYCDEDALAAHKLKAFQNHKIFSIEEKSAKQFPRCGEHPKEELIDYCVQCSKYICSGKADLWFTKTKIATSTSTEPTKSLLAKIGLKKNKKYLLKNGIKSSRQLLNNLNKFQKRLRMFPLQLMLIIMNLELELMKLCLKRLDY
jgi:hypothetical protein